MRKEMKTMKTFSKQFAVSYVVYMMGGSYFHSTECRNPLEEKRLFLHYAEMKKQTQIEEECKVIQTLEKLNKEFLEALGKLKSEVHFGRNGNFYVVDFQTGGFESLSCQIGVNGEIRILQSNFPK